MLGRNARTRTSKEIKMQIAKMVAGGRLEGLCMQLLHAPKAFKRKEEEKKKKKVAEQVGIMLHRGSIMRNN